MSNHIEEAWRLEPVAHIVTDDKERKRVTLATQYDPMASSFWVDGEIPEGYSVEPLVRLSDAQAAISAAEERGRKAERAKIDEERGYIVDENGNKGWIVP